MQPHALALGHFRQFGQGKNQHLSIVAHHGHAIARNAAAQRGLDPGAQRQHLFAGLGLRHQLFGRHHKPVARAGGHEEFLSPPPDDQIDNLGIIRQIHHQTHRLAHAAPARQVGAQKRVEPPIAADEQDLVGGLGVKGETGLIAVLEFLFDPQIDMALHGPDPAHNRADHRDRLALDHGFQRHILDLARFGKKGTAAAQNGLFAELLADRLQLGADLLPLQPGAFQKVREPRPFDHQRVAFGKQFQLFQTPQRPQAHVQDGLCLHLGQFAFAGWGRDIVLFILGAPMCAAPGFAHQGGLGLGVIADDVDHPVQIEEGDDEAFKHLQPVIDLFDPVLGAAAQNDPAVVQKGAQHFFEAANLWHLAVDQHVQIKAEPAFQIGVLEQHPHQHIGVHRLDARLQNDADILGALVAHISQNGHLFGLDDLGQLFDQLGFGDLIGDLGDHDLPGAAAQILDLPFGAGAKGSAPGAVCL